MRRLAAVFPIALALGAIILAPRGGAQAQDAREGPIGIEKCRTIDKPGSYRLVNNLTATGDCLVITASFVTIDLAGFTISGQVGVGTGISGGDGVAVRDGSISGFSSGVALGDGIVEGLRVFGQNLGFGTGITATGIVRNNVVVAFLEGTGIAAAGTVTGNSVAGNHLGISIGPGSTVIGNTAGGGHVGFDVACPSNVTENTAVSVENFTTSGTGCNVTNNAFAP